MKLSRSDKQRFLDVGLSAVRAADTFIKEEIRKGFTTRTKSDGSFVTNVDTGAERLIRDSIKAAFPDHDVTGEELGSSRAESEFRWYIDPIDGTLSFKLGLPTYGTIIALCHGKRPILGIINHPSLNQLYHAVLGSGAYCNGRKIAVGDVSRKRVADEMIATGDVYTFRRVRQLGAYRRLLNEHRLVRTIPDCFGHTLVASGRVGGMVDFDLHEWDFLATRLVIEEAGGKFVITGQKTLGAGDRVYDVVLGKPRVVARLLEIFPMH